MKGDPGSPLPENWEPRALRSKQAKFILPASLGFRLGKRAVPGGMLGGVGPMPVTPTHQPSAAGDTQGPCPMRDSDQLPLMRKQGADSYPKDYGNTEERCFIPPG